MSEDVVIRVRIRKKNLEHLTLIMDEDYDKTIRDYNGNPVALIPLKDGSYRLAWDKLKSVPDNRPDQISWKEIKDNFKVSDNALGSPLNEADYANVPGPIKRR